MRIQTIGLALLLTAVVDVSQAEEILAYRVQLQPDFAQHAIAGITRITIKPEGDAVLHFPVHDLQVAQVSLDGTAIPFHVDNKQLKLDLPPDARHASRLQVDIVYHGAPQEGLIFGDDYVASTWQASDWMICDEAPGRKAPIDIELLLPPSYESLASGVPLDRLTIAPGLVRHRWHEERAYSSYLYGFAAGKFQHATEHAGQTDLHYYGVNDDADSLRRKFAPTAGMLAFLQDKAGVAMPHGAYRQLLIPGDEAQELTSLSVIGTDMLDPILTNPQEDWVIVHEMAHQWWGNLLTCKTWADFWLNEGITTFMVAAYKEQRWGHEAYAHELALQRKHYQVAIDAGYDKALTYGGEYPSLRVRRAIQYAKGALFMDALRTEVGDRLFWKGLRHYTQAHVGGSVTSHDLQLAMEQVAGRKLNVIFDQWVN